VVLTSFKIFAVPAKPATLRSSKSLTPKNLLKTIDTLKISPDTTTMSINVMNAAAAANAANVSAIDIHLLREKSKNLDLPLISALCNDRSLLKQTKAFVMPKHPRAPGSNNTITNSTGLLSSKGKYPVSGLSSTQLSKPRKSAISHRHPNDKLPPLPLQAEANNYVMDPTPTAMKHKNFNSQQSAS
jgi:protein expanded